MAGQSSHLHLLRHNTCLHPVPHVQLAIDALHLGPHSIHRNHQFAGDFGIGVAGGQQPQNLLLLWAEGFNEERRMVACLVKWRARFVGKGADLTKQNRAGGPRVV
jgi:hypothetical protein